MTGAETPTIGILSVDDNPHVGDALRKRLSRIDGFQWDGWLPSADALVDYVSTRCPHIVLLDIDMPGKDPFEALAELVARCPDSRVLVFSGHVRRDLIQRATDAGAWGYVSKNDAEDSLIDAIRGVAEGEFVISDEVRLILGG